MYRSSLPDSSPRIVTDLPIKVEPSAGFMCLSLSLSAMMVLAELYPALRPEANVFAAAVLVAPLAGT
jgi:hypothetical protein